MLYSEAFRWNNAYPLNPRPAQPQPPYTGLAAPVAPGDSPGAPTAVLGGHFMAVPELRLVACGDWCVGRAIWEEGTGTRLSLACLAWCLAGHWLGDWPGYVTMFYTLGCLPIASPVCVLLQHH